MSDAIPLAVHCCSGCRTSSGAEQSASRRHGLLLKNPPLDLVNAFRYGLLGVSDIRVDFALAMIVLFIVVAWFYSLYLLESGKRLRQ